MYFVQTRHYKQFILFRLSTESRISCIISRGTACGLRSATKSVYCWTCAGFTSRIFTFTLQYFYTFNVHWLWKSFR